MDVIALIVTGIGVAIAGFALFASRRSAASAERSAAAAEDSAASSRRSADAAEQSVHLQAKSLDFETARHAEEKRQEAERRAPRFEPKGDHSAGAFNLHANDPRFGAHLLNVGGSVAKAEQASLDHHGNTIAGRFLAGDEKGVQEPAPELRVQPGKGLIIQFSSPEIEPLRQSPERPVLTLVYSGLSDQRWRLVLTLGRMPDDPTRRIQWRVIESATWPVKDD
jgi:hypothetical protein